jgi:predicted esterase
MEKDLELATGLIKIKKNVEARKIVEAFLKRHRHHMYAWWLYAETWPNAEDKKRVWGYCLRFNPDSEEAKKALAFLNGEGQFTTAPPSQNKIKPRRKGNLLFSIFSGCATIIVVPLLFLLIKDFVSPKPIDAAPYFHNGTARYYLYVPKNYNHDKQWPLFVGIHGGGGSGLDCWNLWQPYADKEGFILLCPSIRGDGGGFYQVVGDRTVSEAVELVRMEYNVQPRLFMAGFSAGAIFIQGYAHDHPQSVSGLAILSTAYSIEGVPPVPTVIITGNFEYHSSIEANERLYADMRKRGADVEYHLQPWVGHTVTDKARRLTIECFRKTIGK